MTEATSHPILELEKITKRFGKVVAARDVDLTISSGEVVGLVGDNGAGKSTVVKIISGYIKPSSGTMKLRGEPVNFSSPSDARAAGIETVYQDLAIVNDVSLWRNFFLGKEVTRRVLGIRFLRSRAMAAICEEQLGGLGLTSVESAWQTAVTLSGGERQSLAITRAIHFESSLLLLDEPVAALSVRETRRVFGSIERAKSEGLGILYIDHNMDHVLPVADRIAVMHHGGVSRIVRRGEMSAGELADVVARSEARGSSPAGS
jgi:simple sugar transport system ATP-binding protein